MTANEVMSVERIMHTYNIGQPYPVRSDYYAEERQKFLADLSLLFEQTARGLVQKTMVNNGKVWCGDNDEWEKDKINITENGLLYHLPQNIVIRGETHTLYIEPKDILLAITQAGEKMRGREVMAYKTCEDCGCRVYHGHCVNCHEETYIAEQNASNDEPIVFSHEFNEKLMAQERRAIDVREKLDENRR